MMAVALHTRLSARARFLVVVPGLHHFILVIRRKALLALAGAAE